MNKEAGERAKRAAGETKRDEETQEAKEKARKEAVAIAERTIRAAVFPVDDKKEGEEARQRAKREAEEAKRVKTAEERAKKEAEKALSAELYSGVVKFAIVSPLDNEQVKELEEFLSRFQNLRLVLVGGSVQEGTKIIVSTEKPIALANILSEMPHVERVVEKGKEIQVTLKAKP